MLEIYATCLLLSKNRTAFIRQFALFPNYPLATMSPEGHKPEQFTEFIDLGCHAFVMDQDVLETFLDVYIRSHDLAMFRNPNKTIIVLRDPDSAIDRAVLFDMFHRHPAMREIVNISLGEWGTIYENWTGNGIVGTLAERRADVGIGSLLSWWTSHQYLGFTAVLRKVGIGCFVPRPHLIPTWKTVALVFSPTVWICSVLSVVCCIAMYDLISRYDPSPEAEHRSLGWNAVNVVAMFLFNGAKILYGSLSECVLSIALIAFTINFGNIFIGKNASLQAFPLFDPPIDTIEDMAKAGMIWSHTHEAWAHSVRKTSNPYLMQVATNYRIHPIPELNVLADQGKVGFAVSKMNYGHFMIGDFITAKNVMLYRMMTEDLYFDWEVSKVTKTWPLKDLLSDMILRFNDGGLREFQEPVQAKRHMDYGVQIKIFHSQDREEVPPHAMGCEDLMAPFIVLGAGVVVALVTFVGEMTWSWVASRMPKNLKWAVFK
ncbi:conserved hypothetical protein [Culex quinquefasciatus]|uniref:Ionotropic glutamate receptor C-terminal domain-containing protein n=1 Tax=Culex quinquefasciatus TaxID=7176 RepID=B0XC73_CULQU|nr:conserved hypothetical protein [Culex quinquefasciatus]|eukprot:XP_001867245.1 conserved hypothetical protein [Culex quinquefasciatus]